MMVRPPTVQERGHGYGLRLWFGGAHSILRLSQRLRHAVVSTSGGSSWAADSTGLKVGPERSLSGTGPCPATLYAMAHDFCKSYSPPER